MVVLLNVDGYQTSEISSDFKTYKTKMGLEPIWAPHPEGATIQDFTLRNYLKNLSANFGSQSCIFQRLLAISKQIFSTFYYYKNGSNFLNNGARHMF